MKRRDPGPYPGFWMRLLAGVLDLLAFVALVVPALLIAFGTEHWEPGAAAGSVRWLVDWVAPSALILGFWFWRGATPGKMAVGAVIVDAATGAPARKAQLVVRYLGYFLSALPLGLGFIWIAFDARKQGWHDRLAGTLVARRSR